MTAVAESNVAQLPTRVNADKASEIIEAVIARGDLAQLTPGERAKLYVRTCESLGLNPMTRPFEYINLNGKLVLYARKDCSDQLRRIYNVSVTELIESERDGVMIITAKVRKPDGRTDVAKGAVSINGLKGEALANALMKAETKAKRRATLSICGLGFLDESELPETAQSANEPPDPDAPTPATAPEPTEPPEPGAAVADTTIPGFLRRDGEVFDAEQWLKDLEGAFEGCEDATQLADAVQKYMTPHKGKVSAADFDRGGQLSVAAFQRITREA